MIVIPCDHETSRSSPKFRELTLIDLTNVGQTGRFRGSKRELAPMPAWDAVAIETRHAFPMAPTGEIWKTSPIEI